MQGRKDEEGIVQMAIKDVFGGILIAQEEKKAGDGQNCTVKASFIEVYNKTVWDLLVKQCWRNRCDHHARL